MCSVTLHHAVSAFSSVIVFLLFLLFFFFCQRFTIFCFSLPRFLSVLLLFSITFFCILYRLKLCLLLPVAGVYLGHICFSATLIEACSMLSREYSRLLRRHSCQPLSLTYVYCILPSPNDLF